MALLLDNCEGMLLSVESHKSVPAPFLTKTYQLVDDPTTDHIVSWGEDDTTFVVWRPPEFARDLLPNYFKHNNFSSFVRQLNTYGFRKIVHDRWEFANEFFRKGEKHLLCEIHRRKTSQGAAASGHVMPLSRSLSPTTSDDQDQWSPLSTPMSSPRGAGGPTATSAAMSSAAAVSVLSDDNERLRRNNSMLLSELAHMRKLYNDIIYFVQHHVRIPLHDVSCVNRLKYPNTLLLEGAPPPPPTPRILDVKDRHFNPREVVEMPSVSAPARAPFNAGSLSNLQQSYAATTTKEIATTPRGSSLSFVDSKLRELTTSSNSGSSVTVAEEAKSPPKLFGVPIHGKKRLHPGTWNDQVTSSSTTRTTTHPSLQSSKGLRTDLALNLRPPSVETPAPLLKLCSPGGDPRSSPIYNTAPSLQYM